MYRTHTCGELRASDIKAEVKLAGWVHSNRDHGGVIFIDLRDKHGLTQIVFDPREKKETHAIAEHLGHESVIAVTGTVRARGEGLTNPKLDTGEIEVLVSECTVLSKSDPIPFEIDEYHDKVNEDTRMQYRYLDLRRERMQKNLQLRSDMTKTIRDFFLKEGFVDVETPILIKGTPEGSREYLVPSRLHHGQMYVLPQSPQQLKQLLMVGGLDKYFQVARCFRDEDLRGDRQPEFTQFEIEMSFVHQEEVIDVIERCFIDLTEKHASDKKFEKKFPRMTYDEAMRTYGSDKPDIRFDLKFVDMTEEAKNCGFGVFENADHVFALPISKKYGEFTRKMIDDLTEHAKRHGAGGLAWVRVGEESGPVVKYASEDFVKMLQEKTKTEPGDLILFGAGNFIQALEPLGEVRSEIGNMLRLKDPNVFAYLWVYNFPMFEKNSEGHVGAVHHPFTRPLDEDQELLESDPLKARAVAYDIVLNGVELGGGSVRIHEADLQSRIFDILGISSEDAEKRFGHMLKAFKYGAPPHGGCAMGLDRTVMLFAEEPNIREVTAFPKTGKAQDLMLGAPSQMPDQQLEELGIRIIEEE